MMFKEVGRRFEGVEGAFDNEVGTKFGPNIDPNSSVVWRSNPIITEELSEKEELLDFLKSFGDEWQVIESPKVSVPARIIILVKDRKRSLNHVLNKYVGQEFLYIHNIVKDIMNRNLDPIQVLQNVVELTKDNYWATVLAVAKRYINER